MNKQESSYRWVVFSTVLLAYFIIISQRTAPGLITDQLMNDFHVSAAVIGLMSSFQFFAYAGFQIPVGLLSDRYGPNRFLILGTILTGIGCIIYNFSPNEYILIFSRFLVGIGDSMIFVNLVIILSQWFKANEFVKLLGVISLFSSLGSLMATVPFSVWISFAGWRTPFLTIGIILVLLSYFLYTVLVLKPKRIFKDDIEMKRKSAKNKESVWVILRRTIAARQAWATFLCHFGLVGAYVGFIGSWGVPYGIHVLDLSRSEASQLMMYGLFGAILGGPLISWITSRLGTMKKVYTFVHIVTFLSWGGLVLSGVNPSFILVVILFFLIGFGNGASALTFAVVRKSFPIEEVGVVTGFSNMGGFISAVLLPIVFGKVLDFFPQDSINIGYHYGFIIPVLFSLMGVAGAIMIKEEKTEEKIMLNAL
ncbi:MFS transporter [Bacillus sp. EB106-08-02-XG196]|uniref:MFS transporter n=1 Tax=Bacillus sp. EB106-08-02-XG196 TaxID=2737049 RepID=UPI0015C45B24|nr:MFS transporter [Bacillus sp. EB106-08-02-XG196]NWQ42730.1 MFS transporter [Bacillus sp. EB106-08-02-XG196]